MSVAIKTVFDKIRGCGWRKPGGMYLRSEGVMTPCGRLPLELTICPCCSAGVKPTRGWTWINPKLLFKKAQKCKGKACDLCPLAPANLPTKAGLIWIGGSFYKRPADWLQEAAGQGVSRKIKTLPKGFKLGETVVMVAHRAAIASNHPSSPGIFHLFKPSAVEYVVTGQETDAQLKKLVARGITPVKVQRDGYLDGEVGKAAQ